MSQAEVSEYSRSLPYSSEAERSLLGAMLLPSTRDEVISSVINELGSNPTYFYKDSHKIIYETITDMFEEETDVDALTVGDELEKRDKLENVGGANYLAELVNSVPTAAHVDHYAEIVKEKYTHRELIATCEDIIKMSYQEMEDPDQLLDQAEEQIFSIKEKQVQEGMTKIKDIVQSTFEQLEEADSREDVIAGLRTGYSKLDEMTSGLQESQLIIIAARPGMGKTSFALNIAQHVALDEEEPVAIFSMEMSKNALVMRLLASVSMVSFAELRDGKLSDPDWHKVANGLTRLSEAPIFLDDNSNIDVLDMKARARRLKAEHGLSLLIVDYLQLMNPVDSSIPREQQLANISRGLKQIAMELDIPVIALTQLNREVERRGGDKRPQLSDLRGSGAIEQDADLVSFIYRKYVYSQKEEDKGTGDIILAKQRNGPTGTVQLSWVEEQMRFAEPEQHREPKGETSSSDPF